MQELHQETPLMDTKDSLRHHRGGAPSAPSDTTRPTAQAAFNVTSVPSPTKQLVALSIKNVRVRTRDLAQTL